MSDVQIIGLDKLVYTLNHLPERTSYSILIRALKKASAPIQRAARQNVPKRTGNLMYSIKTFPGKSKDYPAVWTGPTSGKRAGKHDGWYAHFFHFGTKGFGKRTRSGKVTIGYSRKGGGLKAVPFMSMAFDEKVNEAYGLIHSELSKSVVRFMQKNLPK